MGKLFELTQSLLKIMEDFDNGSAYIRKSALIRLYDGNLFQAKCQLESGLSKKDHSHTCLEEIRMAHCFSIEVSHWRHSKSVSRLLLLSVGAL